MDNLYIVMPAYNEEPNIESVVRNWYKVLNVASADSKMIVASSGSTDKTYEILLNLKNELPQLIILSDTLKQHGPKLIALYKYAVCSVSFKSSAWYAAVISILLA